MELFDRSQLSQLTFAMHCRASYTYSHDAAISLALIVPVFRHVNTNRNGSIQLIFHRRHLPVWSVSAATRSPSIILHSLFSGV